MIDENDWRLIGFEENLNGQRFKRVEFPEFWRKAYNEKNDFYAKIVKGAESFVKEFNRGKEWLEGEKVQAFWHEHCYFCYEKFTTDKTAECYCSPEYDVWVCQTCFDDFKEKFNFVLIDE